MLLSSMSLFRAHPPNQLPVLRVEFQQFLFLGQLEVLETEGRADGAADEAEATFGGDFGGEPLLRLDDCLHLVLFGKTMDGQGSIGINNVDVERLTCVKIPNFNHVVQTVERRHVVGSQQVIDGGERFVARLVVAEKLAVIAPFRMRFEAQFLDVFRCVHARLCLEDAKIKHFYQLECRKSRRKMPFDIKTGFVRFKKMSIFAESLNPT